MNIPLITFSIIQTLHSLKLLLYQPNFANPFIEKFENLLKPHPTEKVL